MEQWRAHIKSQFNPHHQNCFAVTTKKPVMDALREKPRILIIEDDPSVGAATQELLNHLGYDVHWASSANKAFDEIAHDGTALHCWI